MALEAGKKYYFVVYTSGKAPSSNNFQYNALFKMKSATEENGVLKQFSWPQGADKTATEWSKTEYVFTADASIPYVGVRMSWNQNSKFDGFFLGVVEPDAKDLYDASLAQAKAALKNADYDNVRIIHGDIMKQDIAALFEGQRFKIVANLPYYITTPILMKLLESNLNAESITVMMQKEVAERILAEPGGKEYGALSVAVQYRTIAETVIEVPRESFFPAPKVDSEVLKLTLRDEPAVKPIDEALFFRLVKAGFSQRRKTILNSLSTSGYPKEEIAACLEAVGIDNKRRAETLSLQDFCSISDFFSKSV